MLIFWGSLTALVIVCAYLLALALAAACLYFGFMLLGNLSSAALLLSIGALSCAVMIVWSLAPRRDPFISPGPGLDAASQPRLFSEIHAIAQGFDEPMPEEVYLTLDINAGVTQRGGMLWWGSRRILILGLPLLTVLNMSEFRAVLAHEFAHFYGGDTGLGPWIQKARNALARTLQSLTSNSFLGVISRSGYVALARALVVGIFALYWRLFLRLTMMVSRQWEYRADELACAVAGARPLLSGLEKIASASQAWPAFWNSELLPSLQSGFRPPVADGFGRFLVAPVVLKNLETAAAGRRENEKPHIFATHPTLQQRADRALTHHFEEAAEDDSPAIGLLEDAAGLESSALQKLFPNAKLADLPAVEWEQIGAKIHLPNWRAFTAEYRELLVVYCIAEIPAALAALASFTARVRDPKGMLLSREQRAQRCVALIWMAFALALIGDGWQFHTQPGDFCLVKGEARLAPNDLVLRLRQGSLPEAEFRRVVEDLGIATLSLAPESSGTAG